MNQSSLRLKTLFDGAKNVAAGLIPDRQTVALANKLPSYNNGHLGLHLIMLLSVFFFVGCYPATSSRIGPPMNPKDKDCDIEVLTDDQVPSRPYRDIGVVTLKNCPDYATAPCRNWLTKEACLLGGDVVYGAHDPTRDGRPDELAGGVSYAVTVAAYVSHVIPADDDPVLNATPAEPCDLKENTDAEATSDEADDPEAQMCTE